MGVVVFVRGLGILSTSRLLALASNWVNNSVPGRLINDHGPSVCPGRGRL